MFSALFEWNIRELGFDFHPKCKELHLSHLVFADDLFLIPAATPKSFEVTKRTVQEFGIMSGLLPNMQKCQIFIGGLDVLAANSVCNVMQMPGGVLPVVGLSDPTVPSGRAIAQRIKDTFN